MRRLRLFLALLLLATTAQAFTHTTVDLELRGEQSTALTSTQHDSNMTKLETAVNANGEQVEALSSFGGMYISNNANATTVSVADTWYKEEDFTADDQLSGVTFASNGLTLSAGVWLVQAHISLSGTTGNVIQYAFGVDGTADTDHIVERKLGSADVGACPIVGVITVTAGQSLTLLVKNTAATADVTTKYASVAAIRIGP